MNKELFVIYQNVIGKSLTLMSIREEFAGVFYTLDALSPTSYKMDRDGICNDLDIRGVHTADFGTYQIIIHSIRMNEMIRLKIVER